MQYREFGTTGKKVSLLGLGAMRLPKNDEDAVAVIRRAIDLGVNYLDTARVYGESERLCGIALKDGYRDKVYLSTKVPAADMPTWREKFEESMAALDVQYIDFLQAVHGLSWDDYTTKYTKPNGGQAEVLKLRDEGIVKHVCFSCHDTPENMIKLIDTGEFEGITVQYNLIDRMNEDVIAYARERGVGVVIMGPVGGGRLDVPSEALNAMRGRAIKSSVELALRFVLANPNVSTAISGMSSISMVEENVITASREEPLSETEMANICTSLVELDALGKRFCTGCDYCMPCPHGVNISEVFHQFILHRVWGQLDEARRRYAWYKSEPLEPGAKNDSNRNASVCVECGECEPKCPQQIPIIAQLKEAHAELGPVTCD